LLKKLINHRNSKIDHAELHTVEYKSIYKIIHLIGLFAPAKQWQEQPAAATYSSRNTRVSLKLTPYILNAFASTRNIAQNSLDVHLITSATMRDQNCQAFPYGIGNKLVIRSHHPPPPIPRELPKRPSLANCDKSMPAILRCLQNPPLLGSDGNDLSIIKIIEELHVGYGKRAQLVVAKVVESPESLCLPVNQNMFAKIYDLLYYGDTLSEEDPFFGVDYDYTHECAAYRHLSDVQGSIIPRYFGSFTLTVPVYECSRVVRLILIEQIDGLFMDRLDPRKYSREERQEIMKQIINGESSVYTKNVSHEDLRPQNVIIESGDIRTCRVVLVDLGKSVIGRSRNPHDKKEEQRYLPGTAISPLLRWNVHYCRQTYFNEWINWPWQSWLENQYKETESTITKEQRELWAIYDCMLDSKPPPCV
jgi:hypothetical protein